MNAFARLCCLGLTLVLAACAVGPDYHAPALDAPQAYAEARKQGEAQALDLAAWWKTFDDPVLASLVDRAALANLDLAQAQARVVQARAALKAAGAGFWPTLEGTGQISRSKDSKNAVAGSSYSSGSTSTLYTAGFDASWELDVFGKVRRQREAAAAELEASQEELADTLRTLLAEVATNYAALRSAQSREAIARANLKAQDETLEITRTRFQAGLVSYLDVAQAESQRASTAADIPSLQATAKESMHRLAVLLGLAPGALNAELSKAAPLPEPIKALPDTGLPSDLLARRPDVRQAERTLAAASANIGVAQAGFYPTFDLTLGLGLQSVGNKTFLESASRYWSIVPGVNVPLFSGGSTMADVEQKKAMYDESLAAYRAAFLTALEDVENALSGSYAQQERLSLLAQAEDAARRSLDLARERYAKGLTGFLDVLTAQETLYTAQDNLDQCKADLMTQVIALYKALGGPPTEISQPSAESAS